MNREEVITKINGLVIEEFELEETEIDPTGNLMEALQIDSLDLIDLVVIIEKNFGFKVKTEEMSDIKSVNDFYDYIHAKVATPA